MKLILIIISVLALPSLLLGQQIGGLGIGWTNHYGAKDRFDAISNHGISIFALIPIHAPKVDVGIKLRLAHFSYVGPNPKSEGYQFAVVSNELLAGKKLVLKNMSILPQLGYGVRVESWYTDWDIGSFGIDSFLDYSIWIRRDFGIVNLGLLINFETDLKAMDESWKSGRRFNLSFVLSK